MNSEVSALLSWFHHHRRPLPWRTSPPIPYAVWVSEIMLQQTRIDTVIDYFQRFLAAFPTLPDLATADLQDVLRIWQGLGYYSRARNLHRAAQIVARDYHGSLPTSSTLLRTLPGIGEYTAAAIASICAAEPTPVIDGNVLRVASRRLLLPDDIRTPKARATILQWLLPRIRVASHPGDFNQAIMELGETLCSPSSPQCSLCPWHSLCKAATTPNPDAWPKKAPTRPIPTRKAIALIIQRPTDHAILLTQRAGKRFLGEMWELPGDFLLPGETLATALSRLGTPSAKRLGTVHHTYSHFKLALSVYASPTPPTLDTDHSAWILPSELPSFPLSKAPKVALQFVSPPPP